MDFKSFAGYQVAEAFAHGTADFKSASFFADKMIQSGYASDEDLNKKLYSYLILSGDFTQARLLLKSKPEFFKSNRLGQFLLLTDSVLARNFDYARTVLDAMGGKNPDQLALPLIKTWVLAAQNKKEDAFAEIEKLNQNATHLLYLSHKLYLSFYFKDFEGAFVVLKQLDLESHLNPRFVSWASDFLFFQGEREKALDFVKKHLESDLSYSGNQMISLLKDKKKPETFSFSVSDGLAESFLDLSLALVQPKTIDLALFLSRLASEVAVSPFTLYFSNIVSGELLEKEKAFSEALILFKSVPKTSPFYPSALLKQARVYKQMGFRTQAIVSYETLVESYPDYLLAQLLLGELYVQNRDYDLAESLYLNLVEKRPSSDLGWEVSYYLGLIYDWKGEPEKAEKYLLASFEKSNRHPVVLNYLGYFWIENKKKTEEALDLIKEALTKSPLNVEFWDSYGWALFKTNELEKAKEVLEIAIVRDGANSEIRDHLGDVYWALGQKTNARHQWRHALFFKDIGLGLRDYEAVEKKLAR